jgi:hypothetical protein
LSLLQGDQSVDPFNDLYTRIEADFCGLEAEANENEGICSKRKEKLKEKTTIRMTLKNTIPPPQ